MPIPLPVTFAAGAAGEWRIDRLERVTGDGLPGAEWLARLEGPAAEAGLTGAVWLLRSVMRRAPFSREPAVSVSLLSGVKIGANAWVGLVFPTSPETLTYRSERSEDYRQSVIAAAIACEFALYSRLRIDVHAQTQNG